MASAAKPSPPGHARDGFVAVLLAMTDTYTNVMWSDLAIMAAISCWEDEENWGTPRGPAHRRCGNPAPGGGGHGWLDRLMRMKRCARHRQGSAQCLPRRTRFPIHRGREYPPGALGTLSPPWACLLRTDTNRSESRGAVMAEMVNVDLARRL